MGVCVVGGVCVCVNVCGMGVGDVDVWVMWVYGWCGCIGSMRVCV